MMSEHVSIKYIQHLSLLKDVLNVEESNENQTLKNITKLNSALMNATLDHTVGTAH